MVFLFVNFWPRWHYNIPETVQFLLKILGLLVKWTRVSLRWSKDKADQLLCSAAPGGCVAMPWSLGCEEGSPWALLNEELAFAPVPVRAHGAFGGLSPNLCGYGVYRKSRSEACCVLLYS